MSQKTDLSIVLPIFNEVENITPLLQEIDEALLPTGMSYEIIAVDDGSRDGTRELLKKLAGQNPRLKTIFFRKNSGQSAAFDAGFRAACGSFLVTMDADRQNDPRDIPKLLSRMDEGFDFVTGWRKKRRDGFLLRTFPSRLANFIIRKVTRSEVHDMGCSLKAYRREIYTEIHLYGEMHRFISVIAENLGARVSEVVVNHRPRTAGVSKYGLTRTLKVVLDLLTIWFFRGYQTKPIYVFGTVGAGMLTFSFGAAAFTLYQKFAHDVWVHRNPLFTLSAVAAMIGFQFLGLGILCEIMVRTYFESQKKVAYLISETMGFGADAPEKRTRAA
jgi:glycosyltransferase involved in cell wall biosynthesis